MREKQWVFPFANSFCDIFLYYIASTSPTRVQTAPSSSSNYLFRQRQPQLELGKSRLNTTQKPDTQRFVQTDKFYQYEQSLQQQHQSLSHNIPYQEPYKVQYRKREKNKEISNGFQ